MTKPPPIEYAKQCPPPPPSTEYVRKKPPEPPKPRCIADEPGYAEKRLIWHSKLWFSFALIMTLVALSSLVFVFDSMLDPKRTDHAVQAGIRECERTLPRTQTCELSQLSFKVVEKKAW